LRTDRGFAIAYPAELVVRVYSEAANAAELARLSSAAKQWIFE
jgi:hypothetical protein